MLRNIVVAILLFFALPVFAGDEMVYSNGNVTVRLTLEACTLPVIAAGLIEAESKTPPRKAYVTYGKTEIIACWGSGEGKVLLGDELGNGGFISMADFKKAESI